MEIGGERIIHESRSRILDPRGWAKTPRRRRENRAPLAPKAPFGIRIPADGRAVDYDWWVAPRTDQISGSARRLVDLRQVSLRLRQRAPPAVWRILSGGFVLGCDVVDKTTHRGVERLPPARLRIRIGTPEAGRFLESGRLLPPLYSQFCGLIPESRVLDVGCGCGRVARPLSTFLTPPGTYEGFDVDRAAVDYCITAYRDVSNFRFLLADVRTSRYNPDGRLSSLDFRFPYDDGSFDFVNLTSVMTHLLPDHVKAYLSELHRVLKPSGKAWVTFFLLSEEARRVAIASRGSFRFPYPYGVHRIEILRHPEAGICHDEDFVWAAYRAANLRPVRVFRGSWLGRAPELPTPFANLQDVVITSRAS